MTSIRVLISGLRCTWQSWRQRRFLRCRSNNRPTGRPPAGKDIATAPKPLLCEGGKGFEHADGKDAFQGLCYRDRSRCRRRGYEQVNLVGHDLNRPLLPTIAFAQNRHLLFDMVFNGSCQDLIAILRHEDEVIVEVVDAMRCCLRRCLQGLPSAWDTLAVWPLG